jgi:hypothetical protein
MFILMQSNLKFPLCTDEEYWQLPADETKNLETRSMLIMFERVRAD